VLAYLSRTQRVDPPLTALFEDQVASCACYGPTPLIQGILDLYWTKVSPEYKKRGIGRLLIQQVLQRIGALEGRLLLADSSGQKEYTPTRAFYERCGFTNTSRIKDFYAPGDDFVVDAQTLNKA
jgi:ribosomal protein S18 acetylase RimI-like enzyme